jgi:hypothetical protein
LPEGAVEEEGQQEKFGRTHEVREGGGDGGGLATPGGAESEGLTADLR